MHFSALKHAVVTTIFGIEPRLIRARASVQQSDGYAERFIESDSEQKYFPSFHGQHTAAPHVTRSINSVRLELRCVRSGDLFVYYCCRCKHSPRLGISTDDNHGDYATSAIIDRLISARIWHSPC